MYSPKIKEDLISMLYRIKQSQNGKPMTQIVDEMLRPQILTLHDQLVQYNSRAKGGEKQSDHHETSLSMPK